MKYFVHLMANQRCKVLLQEELAAIGLNYTLSDLERTEITEIGSATKYEILKKTLHRFSLETGPDRRSLLVEKLKATILEMINHTDDLPRTKCSVYLSDKLKHNYTYLSNLFSQMNGSTLEHYIISQRVEVAKQLLLKHDLTLSEIAWRLGYCSVAHLSNQFKKITGTTPTGFKGMAQKGALPYGLLCEPCKQQWIDILEGAELHS